MQFNTKLHAGATIWHITNRGIKSTHITEIHIVAQPQLILITYNSNDGITFDERDENKIWWRTHDAVVKHLLGGPEQPCHSECQCTGGNKVSIEELFDQMMTGEDIRKQLSKPRCGHCHQDLEGVIPDIKPHTIGRPKHIAGEEAIDKEFDELFGEHVCTRPTARNKNELNQLYEELFDR